MKTAILVSLLALSACGTTAVQQATLVNGAVTLAGVAAANNTTVDQVVAKGALFCATKGPLVPLVVALANAAGAPVSVTGQASADVAAACAAIQAVPVAPPAHPEAAPVMAAPVLPAAV
jgi:hypothetical protein